MPDPPSPPAPSYHSLEDFLTANVLTVDAIVPDGWSERFPVKGREIDATVLFADITGFTARTADLDPTETLSFVNHFFTWIAAEALRNRPGIVDKYIGDEIMVVFSKEFGSASPFLDAVHTARWMGQNDVLAFTPHIGIASGRVIVGYAGTPLKYSCSVFGRPVALAARCAATKPDDPGPYSTYATFPAAEADPYSLDQLVPTVRAHDADGSAHDRPNDWQLTDTREVEMRGLGDVAVRHLGHRGMWFPTQTAEQYAKNAVAAIADAGRRWHSDVPAEIGVSRPGTRTDPDAFA
ncbi:MAG: adenylate/guanylate cyclase domain-containing protein [Solirubrobacteraceae bacterium]